MFINFYAPGPSSYNSTLGAYLPTIGCVLYGAVSLSDLAASYPFSTAYLNLHSSECYNLNSLQFYTADRGFKVRQSMQAVSRLGVAASIRSLQAPRTLYQNIGRNRQFETGFWFEMIEWDNAETKSPNRIFYPIHVS